MFLRKNASGERMGIVRIENRYRTLQDDRTVVEVLIDEVNSAASNFDAVIEGLRLRFKAGKRGQQRWMDVDDSIGEGGDELGRKQAHVTGQADQIDTVFDEAGRNVSVVFGAGTALRNKEFMLQTQVAGDCQSRCIRDVRNDERYLNAP